MLFCGALLVFAYMDTTTKYLAAYYNVPLIVAIRYMVHCLLMVVILGPSQGTALVQTQRTGLVLLRAASLAIASLFMGLALQRMPVAETTAIVFLGPMFVVLLAGPLLGEKVGLIDWIAAVLGFIGVLMVARPGSYLDTTGTLFAVLVVVMLVIYQLLSRVLARTEQTYSLVFYAALLGSIGYGVFLPWSLKGPTPTNGEFLLFLSVGVSAGLGHYLYTAAYRHAPASLLAPMNYMQLLWAGLLGWIVFNHVPDKLSIIGMCVIAVSGALLAIKSRPAKPIESDSF